MTTWTQPEALPIVHSVIKRLLRKHATVTHAEIASEVMKDARGRKLIRKSRKKSEGKFRSEDVASKMVAFFSQRHTLGTSGYEGEFRKFKEKLSDTYTYQLAGQRNIRRRSLKARKNRRSAANSSAEKTRRPSTLDEYKKAFSYALGSSERQVIPAHHNYQVLLKEFLTRRGVSVEFERDFVDVKFSANRKIYIGEIKVTGFLKIKEAFRIALGQLLEYAHLRFPMPPRMVMFLDKEPDKKRIALATNFSISVIVGGGSGYRVLNPAVAPSLVKIFSSA